MLMHLLQILLRKGFHSEDHAYEVTECFGFDSILVLILEALRGRVLRK